MVWSTVVGSQDQKARLEEEHLVAYSSPRELMDALASAYD